jgi:hypothetical protein
MNRGSRTSATCGIGVGPQCCPCIRPRDVRGSAGGPSGPAGRRGLACDADWRRVLLASLTAACTGAAGWRAPGRPGREIGWGRGTANRLPASLTPPSAALRACGVSAAAAQISQVRRCGRWESGGGSRLDEGEKYVVDDLGDDALGWRDAGEEELVAEQVRGQRSDHGADLSAGLAPVGGTLEDRRHDPGADVQNLLLETGEQLAVGKVLAEQAVDGLEPVSASRSDIRRLPLMPT